MIEDDNTRTAKDRINQIIALLMYGTLSEHNVPNTQKHDLADVMLEHIRTLVHIEIDYTDNIPS
jgi:hypothetical protein